LYSSYILFRTWAQLAEVSHPSVFIANIDCGIEKDLCRSYHITTYPTFRYYLNGVEHDYEDAQSLEALREFVDTKLSPQCNPIKDETSCSERGLQFGKKWISKSSLSSDGDAMLQSEIERLEKIMLHSTSMTEELMRWIRERRYILKIILHTKLEEELQQADAAAKDEL
jgi:hypothetical protein